MDLPVVTTISIIDINPYEVPHWRQILSKKFQYGEIQLAGFRRPELDVQDNGDHVVFNYYVEIFVRSS